MIFINCQCTSKVLQVLIAHENYLSDSDPKKYVNLRPNDVVIASYPRSGGNFVSEILYNIVVSTKYVVGVISLLL